MIKVEHIAEESLETRCNELVSEGFILHSVIPHPFNTENAAPMYVTIWTIP